MTKRRVIRWSLILVTFATFAVWLEPTRVVWGWLRGAAFYQGRPASYWRAELSHWQSRGPMPGVTVPNDEIMCFGRNPTAFELWLDHCRIRTARYRRSIAPPLLDGDVEALSMLDELSHDAPPRLLLLIDRGRDRIRRGWQPPPDIPDWLIPSE